MNAFVKYWVPVVAWMLLIFVMSGDLMSAEHASRFLVPFLRWLAPDISPATVASIQLLFASARTSGNMRFWRLCFGALLIGTNGDLTGSAAWERLIIAAI